MTNEKANLLQSMGNIRKYMMIVMWGFIFFTMLKLIGSVINLFIFSKYNSDQLIATIEPLDEIKIAIIGLFNLPWLLLWLIIFILYSGWVYRTYTNLMKQRVQGLKMTPAWAAGWNFMPVMNLIMPYMVMKEIWLATSYSKNNSKEWKSYTVPKLLSYWWIFFIIGIFTFINWFQFGQTFIYLQVGGFVSIISAISFIISGLMLLKIMKQISVTQVARFKKAG